MSPDEQTALSNVLFRNSIKPAMPPGMAAFFITVDTTTGFSSFCSTMKREYARMQLRSLLAIFDQQAKDEGIL